MITRLVDVAVHVPAKDLTILKVLFALGLMVPDINEQIAVTVDRDVSTLQPVTSTFIRTKIGTFIRLSPLVLHIEPKTLAS